MLVYMNNIEAHPKDDNCFHDDDDNNGNTQIIMHNFKPKQRKSRLCALLGTACVVILPSLSSSPKFSVPLVLVVN